MQLPAYDHHTIDFENLKINGSNLVALPAVVDPHVHFRVPGGEHKEDWRTGARAAIAGGVTTVLEMPNNTPPITTLTLLRQKKALIDEQLTEVGIPLQYGLYLGATPDNLDEIRAAKDEIVGIKLFMGSSTGNLLVDKLADQEKIFQLAAELNLPVAVHAENEALIKKNKAELAPIDSIAVHSKIRNAEVAASAVAMAIELAEKFGTTLYILHVSTRDEVTLIREAKKKQGTIFAEVTPHHLFLNSDAYEKLGTKAQMNPPLRTREDQEALFAALLDGTIDCVGTDHAPHLLQEKAAAYPASPSGVPGIETSLPLLLDRCNAGKLPLEKLVAITSANARKIFKLQSTNDWVIVDLDKVKEVQDSELKTKCAWSPFNGWKLKGWPVATILNGKIFYAL